MESSVGAGLEARLQQQLKQREQEHLYRTRKVLASAQGVHAVVDGKKIRSFCSNDYLGLANHPEVIQAFKKGVDDYGVGSGASHLVSGHSTAHHQLEEELAEFTGRDRAVLFSSGYMANLGVMTALLGKGDFVFQDKTNHASLLDAGLLSGTRFQRYLHNDIQSLEKHLIKVDRKSGETLIVSDGVFSMDGDIAPLKELAELASKNNASLMVDDAHGIGVLGESGAGCVDHFDLNQKQVPVLMGTLGKAFGTFGAFVAGSETLIESLIQFSRTYIYTTALPPAVAVASSASLKIIQQDKERREHLQNLITYFRKEAGLLGLNLSENLMDSQTAIQPIIFGESEKVVEIGENLLEHGLLVGVIRPPTVAAGTARLRITLCAEHTENDVDDLLGALK